jgi:hypothetical protein
MECFVIAACLALVVSWIEESEGVGLMSRPTDPVLAASVVKGVFAEVSHQLRNRAWEISEADNQRHVPPYIRDLLLV